MTNIDWRNVIVGSFMGVALVGCSDTRPLRDDRSTSDVATSTVPHERSFRGTIVSLRHSTSTMLVSKDERVGKDQFPNIITVKYDAHTQFTIDGAPGTIDRIEQYMPVSIVGHMREGQLVADTAQFSTQLPANVRRAPQAKN